MHLGGRSLQSVDILSWVLIPYNTTQTCIYDLFEFIRNAGKLVTVIDAGDLQKDPKKVMKKHALSQHWPAIYNKMLTWTPGVVYRGLDS